MVSHYPWDWPDGRPARFQVLMPRLLTYNVHRCVGVDRKLDVARIVGVIAEHEPDIVCLQELDVGRARTGHVDQARSIADGLAMTFHFNAAMKVEAEQYGDAILTLRPERLVKSGSLPTIRGIPGQSTSMAYGSMSSTPTSASFPGNNACRRPPWSGLTGWAIRPVSDPRF